MESIIPNLRFYGNTAERGRWTALCICSRRWSLCFETMERSDTTKNFWHFRHFNDVSHPRTMTIDH